MPLEHEPARDASDAAASGRPIAERHPAGQPAPPQPGAASTPQPRIVHHCFSDEAHDTVVHFQVSASALPSRPCAEHAKAATAVGALCSEASVAVTRVLVCACWHYFDLARLSLSACLPACLAVSTPTIQAGARVHF